MNAYFETETLERFGLAAPRYCLLKHNQIVITGEITSAVAARTVEELLFCASEHPGKDICVNIIDSPGGSTSAGLAILDTIHRVKSPVHTVGAGLVASMAAVLLACGASGTGRRSLSPNSDLLLHQPLGGAQGQCSDIQIAARHIATVRSRIEGLLSEASGLPVQKVSRLLDRDTWLGSEEALELGLIDYINR